MNVLEADGEVRVACASPEEAVALAAALRVDDEGYVETRVEGATVVAVARSESLGSLLAALDDWLACAAAARGAAGAASTV